MPSRVAATITSQRVALTVATLLLVAARPLPAWSQSTQELEWLVNTMTRLCLSGGDQLSLHAAGSGEDDLMLRSQNAEGKIEGEFYIERSRTEGLVGGISGSITTLQAAQASEVRRCLEPLRARLLEIGMPRTGAQPHGSATSASASPPPRPVVVAPPAAPVTTASTTASPPTSPPPANTLPNPPVSAAPPPPDPAPTATASVTPPPSAPKPPSETAAFRYTPSAINESPQGFACRKAAMPMDYVICSFQEVYDINTQHAVAWWATIGHLDKPQREALVQNQKQWIAGMLKSCGLPAAGKPSQAQAQAAAPCVRAAYVDRIRFLRNYQPA